MSLEEERVDSPPSPLTPRRASFKAVRNALPASVVLPESESDAVTSSTSSDAAHVAAAPAAPAAAAAAAADAAPTAAPAKDWSKTSPQLVLRRGAETGDCDAIRFAIDAGADINHQESGKDDYKDGDENGNNDEEATKEAKGEQTVESGDEKKSDAGEPAGPDQGVGAAADSAEGENASCIGLCQRVCQKKPADGEDDDEHLTPAEREARKREATKQALKNLKNLRFNTLDSALHMAARNGHASAVELLVQLGASIDLQNRTGSTALHTAVAHGKVAVVELLLRQQAKVDVPNRLGSTALHTAVYMQNVALVGLLLQNVWPVVQRKRCMEAYNRAQMRPLDYALPRVREILTTAEEFASLDLKSQLNDADAAAQAAYVASNSTLERKSKPAAAATTTTAAAAAVAAASATSSIIVHANPLFDGNAAVTEADVVLHEHAADIELQSAMPLHASPFAQIPVLHREGAPPDDGDGLPL